jgi:hypothetical protein
MVKRIVVIAFCLAAVFVPAAAFAQDYPVTSATVSPTSVVRQPPEQPEQPQQPQVLGNQVSRGGALAVTGGDVLALSAIGAGSLALGVVLVRRSRRTRTA